MPVENFQNELLPWQLIKTKFQNLETNPVVYIICDVICTKGLGMQCGSLDGISFQKTSMNSFTPVLKNDMWSTFDITFYMFC